MSKAKFNAYDDSFNIDIANKKIWTKCILGSGTTSCSGEAHSLTYLDAEKACSMLQYKGLKFRVPTREEYFLSFIDCRMNMQNQDKIIDHLRPEEQAQVKEVNLPTMATKDTGNLSCVIAANDQYNGETYFPALGQSSTAREALWTSTWSYKMFNERYCLTDNPSDKCAIVNMKLLPEQEYRNRLATYHFVLDVKKKSFRSIVATPQTIGPISTPDRASSLCVADLIDK